MQTFLHNLMAAVLLAHGVLGCCWHHALACEEAAATVAAPGCCCGHHHDGEADTSDVAATEAAVPAECPDSDCPTQCAGSCIYLPPQKSNVDMAAFDVACDELFIFAVGMPVDTPLLGGNGLSWLALDGPLESSPPVRLHLLHQSLLI